MITWFEQTPPMSTYLIAFIVADYTFRATTGISNITQRVFVNNETIDQTRYALSESNLILYELEKNLKVKFPLSKLDHAIVYTETNIGGMIYIQFKRFDAVI